MCLAVVALDRHPSYRVVVVANRDEFHARASRSAAWGDTPPFTGILAGRDLQAGGTWLGLRRDGRWALVTNVREGVFRASGRRSRGDLVPRVLNHGASPAAAIELAMLHGDDYNGFNLLCGDREEFAWASNRQTSTRRMASGIHAVSNAMLDTPWPKVVHARESMQAWVRSGALSTAALFAAFADRTWAPDAELPSTGVSTVVEHNLSPAFILGAEYGTRCTTVLTIDRADRAFLHERDFAADGRIVGNATHAFRIERQS